MSRTFDRDVLVDHAKQLAGYGNLDSPCRPSRSAYSDGQAGYAAHQAAQRRWLVFYEAMVKHPELLNPEDFDWLQACPECLGAAGGSNPLGQHAEDCSIGNRACLCCQVARTLELAHQALNDGDDCADVTDRAVVYRVALNQIILVLEDKAGTDDVEQIIESKRADAVKLGYTDTVAAIDALTPEQRRMFAAIFTGGN